MRTGERPRRRQVELFFDRAFAIDMSKRFQTPDELILRLGKRWIQLDGFSQRVDRLREPSQQYVTSP